MNRINHLVLTTLLLFSISSCRDENLLFAPESEQLAKPEFSSIEGVYLLNEGNMGSNKSTLDYYDYTTGTYHRNIYASTNPTVPKELGDVGNDLKIYGSKLYAVINCSNKVEVMDTRSTKRIGQIEIPNCRYIQFHKGYAYITSYAGPVEINPNYQQRGYVAKVDTTTLQIVAKCLVGYQPDELTIHDNKIYVANSGGYMTPNYENNVSVIDIDRFEETHKIEVDINLHRIRADQNGQIWVTSRGDYYKVPSRLFCIDVKTQKVTDTIDIAASNLCIDNHKIYLYSVEWSYLTMSNQIAFGVIDTKTKKIITRNFITDGTDTKIKIPYGIAVHPITKEILVTDAKNYVSPGTLYCFDSNGTLKWNVRTGDIPAHFAFVGK